MKAMITSEVKGMPQINPKIDKGRAGLRWKITTPMSPQINKLIIKLSEKPIEQPKVVLKVPIPESSSIHDKIVPVSDF